MEGTYYTARGNSLLGEFDVEAQHWAPPLRACLGEDLAGDVLADARRAFEALIPQIPYIGGEENPLTGMLIDAVRCLALYQAMMGRGRTAAETGHVLYDAILARAREPVPQAPPAKLLSPEERMARRQQGADRSQARCYLDDYVYTFVPGDGEVFDYGYNFYLCAAYRLYHAQGADAFLPYYCFLDFAWSRARGLGLERTMTLAEGHGWCNHRFKRGRATEPTWPPPFLGEQ